MCLEGRYLAALNIILVEWLSLPNRQYLAPRGLNPEGKQGTLFRPGTVSDFFYKKISIQRERSYEPIKVFEKVK